MPQLHLPSDHDDEDRQVAAGLARALGSSELHVAWSSGQGRARPVVMAACEPARRRRRGLARLLGALPFRQTSES